MRKLIWFVAAGIAASTTGCVETMNDGYSQPAYGYYSRPVYYESRPVYYEPARVEVYRAPTRVVTETRYVPVPVPANNRPVETRRADHHRTVDRDNDRDHDRNRTPDRWQR